MIRGVEEKETGGNKDLYFKLLVEGSGKVFSLLFLKNVLDDFAE